MFFKPVDGNLNQQNVKNWNFFFYLDIFDFVYMYKYINLNFMISIVN